MPAPLPHEVEWHVAPPEPGATSGGSSAPAAGSAQRDGPGNGPGNGPAAAATDADAAAAADELPPPPPLGTLTAAALRGVGGGSGVSQDVPSAATSVASVDESALPQQQQQPRGHVGFLEVPGIADRRGSSSARSGPTGGVLKLHARSRSGSVVSAVPSTFSAALRKGPPGLVEYAPSIADSRFGGKKSCFFLRFFFFFFPATHSPGGGRSDLHILTTSIQTQP
jgi:hypothetical protein